MKNNPLLAVLGFTPGGNGDPWGETLVVLVVPAGHPGAKGRQPGLYRLHRWGCELVYDGEPDLDVIPEGVKVIHLQRSAYGDVG